MKRRSSSIGYGCLLVDRICKAVGGKPQGGDFKGGQANRWCAKGYFTITTGKLATAEAKGCVDRGTQTRNMYHVEADYTMLRVPCAMGPSSPPWIQHVHVTDVVSTCMPKSGELWGLNCWRQMDLY
jgi:hypothetical protein